MKDDFKPDDGIVIYAIVMAIILLIMYLIPNDTPKDCDDCNPEQEEYSI